MTAPPALSQLIESLCAEQRRRWQSGERVLADTLIDKHPTIASHPDQVVELVYNEVLLREEHGETPRLEEYLMRFPQLSEELRRLFEVHGALGSEVLLQNYHSILSTRRLRRESGPATLVKTLAVPGYEILSELGRGGMGIVYQARHLALNRQVALKLIRTGIHADVEELARFHTEAEAAARVQHPHLVQIFDVGETEGQPYLALEYVEGGNLAQKIAGTPQPPPQAAHLLEILARAMHAAHQRNLIHRDLKPANVLLTADGTPKITDFGLAKRIEGEAGASATGGDTKSGTILGTPSYMAPEQASGQSKEIGPAADIYALGVILYEMLTGRPPFLGESPLDTLHQVKTLEPVPPRRLQPKVPRDLETICLKCLQKEPTRRYEDAAALAEDLRRFQVGEPIRARPVGYAERSWRWCRRKPALAGLTAALLGLVVLAGGGGLWVRAQQAEQGRQFQRARQAVEAALEQVQTLQHQWRWAEADAVLVQAESRLGESAPSELLQRLVQARKDLALAARLDALRLRLPILVESATLESDALRPRRSMVVMSDFDHALADRHYTAAFAEAGLAQEGEDAAVVAARIRDSAIRTQLVAALDDWVIATNSPRRRGWLLDVGRQADPHGGRDRFRDPRRWINRAALEKLAAEAAGADLPPQLLATLGAMLLTEKADPVPLLTAAQKRYPNDFWLNFWLGMALTEVKPVDAVGYHRAALALRPETAAVYNNLGLSLRAMGRRDEAIDAHQKAVDLNPQAAMAYNNLGVALRANGRPDAAETAYRQAMKLDDQKAAPHANLGYALYDLHRLDEAIDSCRKATQLAPKAPIGYLQLGVVLRAATRLDEAIGAYREAIRLDPDYAMAHNNLCVALRDKGVAQRALPLLDEAITAGRTAVKLDPKDPKAHYNLALACYSRGQHDDKGLLDEAIAEFRKTIELGLGDALTYASLGNALHARGLWDEANAAYQKAIALGPPNASTHYNLGNVLKDQGRLDEAIAEYRKATAIDPKKAQAFHGLGVALSAKGQLDDAIAAHQEATSIDPKLVRAHGALGVALAQKGRFTEAAASFRSVLKLLPPSDPLHTSTSQQLKQWERMHALEEKLPDILQGGVKPADAVEQVLLAHLCQKFQHRYAASARFYADAFAARPELADASSLPHRYNAACAAVLAAAGKGKDADSLGEVERTRLREQARTWLEDELKKWTKLLESNPDKARAVVLRTMQNWQKDADLAGVRELDAMTRLPEPERLGWLKLWGDVQSLRKRAGPSGER